MSMQNARDMLAFEMRSMYDAEQRLVQILPQLAREVQNQQIRGALQQHEQETKQQINNLEQCFQVLGMNPERIPCRVVEGLKQEHDTFIQEGPSEALINAFDLNSTYQTEYFEIAAYKGLIEQANAMGQQQCVQLLQQNLRQEEEMQRRIESISQQVYQQATQRV